MKSYFKFPKLIMLLFAFLLTGCGLINPIDFVGVDNIVIKQGQSIIITADVKLYNPNNFKFKIVDSDLNIFIEDQSLGKLKLEENLIIGKKEEFTSPIVLKIGFMELLSSGASLLPKFFMREFNVQVKGQITVKAFLFKRKIDVSYNEKVKL